MVTLTNEPEDTNKWKSTRRLPLNFIAQRYMLARCRLVSIRLAVCHTPVLYQNG